MQLGFGIGLVKTPLTFLEEKGGMLLGNTVKLTQVALGLVPEVLDAVEVGCKQLGVVEPKVADSGHCRWGGNHYRRWSRARSVASRLASGRGLGADRQNNFHPLQSQ